MVVVSEIENRKIVKSFLGGWRNKVTGIEYLNAASQTGPLRIPNRDLYSKDVQTVQVKDGSTQPLCNHATQMWRRDHYVPAIPDKYITVKPYETYEEMQSRLDLDGKARIIQKNYRTYKLLKYVKESAHKYREIVENCKKYEEEKAAIYTKRHQREILCKINPQSRADFNMLYSLTEKWRTDRFKNMKLRFFQSSQRAENYFILQKTIEMFNVIAKQQRAVRDRHRNRKRVRFLTIHCKPIQWNGYKGKPVEMVTMKTQKAREYKTMYDLLNNRNVTLEERMEILLKLKRTVERHNCVASFDLLYLVDQESVLLSRGMKHLQLDCLKDRITYSYLHLIKTCDICDEDSRNNKTDEFTEPTELQTKLCKSCTRLLPRNRFAIHSRMKKLSMCTGCSWLLQRNTAPVNYDPYLFILHCVRVEERRRNCFSGLAFVMQVGDVYHLVNNIWHDRSVVSENGDLFLLRLVRYNRDAEWSPWNCILLTEEEAEVHCRVENPAAVYSEHLRHQIALAHQTAKNRFRRLSVFEKNFRESSRYYMIQERREYAPTRAGETCGNIRQF